ncbi:hypothetical protein [Methylobacterium sp. CM6247]
MATHAYTTLSLLPATDSERLALLSTQQARRSLLGTDRGVTPGPVTLAIRGVRSNELSSWEMRQGQLDDEAKALRDLRRRVANAVEAAIAFLDATGGDPDAEPSLGSTEPYDWQERGQEAWSAGSADDRENAECIDCDGEYVSAHRAFISRVA